MMNRVSKEKEGERARGREGERARGEEGKNVWMTKCPMPAVAPLRYCAVAPFIWKYGKAFVKL
jgi:hypothetical protein